MPKKLIALLLLAMGTCTLAVASPDQWTEVSSSHFVVLTNANEKQARHLVDQFERMRWVFQTLFPKTNADPAMPIFVYAGKNGKTFQSVEPQDYLGKGALNLAGYFLTTQDQDYILIRLDAEQEHAYATVYHEYTHLQFRSAGAWMPLWLNEGLAEFFQNTDIHDKDVNLGQPSIDNILYLRQQRIIPLPVLFKVDASSPYYHEENKGSIFYAESWALTHYLMLMDRTKGTNHLWEYMKFVANHEDPVVAAQKAFGDLKQLELALSSYVAENQFKMFVLHSAAAPIDESSITVKPVSQSEADARRAEILALVHREREARDLAASILKADPNNAIAMETMGGIELHSGNFDAARKWYGDAARLDSGSFLANYYFARMSLQGRGSEADPAVEQSFRTAIRLNPKFAPAYDGLASYYSMHSMRLDEAYMLITSAIRLDPGNFFLRLNASNVVSQMGRYDEATSILQAATRLARNPGELGILQSRINEMKQIQAARAQAQEESNHFDSVQAESKGIVEVVHDEAPRHPAEAKGARHSVLGVMREVACSYPALLEMSVDSGSKSIKVYSNDFSKINLTVVGFTPQGSMNPCKDFNGMKARVQYAEADDKTVDGQVLAIELRK